MSIYFQKTEFQKLVRSALLVFIVISISGSCKERPLDFELPYAGDRLVIFSQTKAGDTLKVEVQKTYPPTGQSTYSKGITTATVKVFDKKGYVETLRHVENGTYISSNGLIWKENETYKIEAEAPDYPKITTDLETMPSAPTILSYEFSKDIDSRYNPGTPSRELIIKIQDTNPNDSDYYMVIIKREVGKEIIGVNEFDLDKSSEFEDPCEFRYVGTFVFPDLCKNNAILTFRKGLELTYTYSKNIDPKARDKIIIYTRKISKNYYEFCKTYYEEDDLIVAFKTPYPRYSNINEGFGIFATYTETQKEFILKE
ncbi:DUF4249 domain-containing protein [Arundinibacter roseus]|uniref:DUF4249 domain-containing protein n=1 Tax=Arundinibacter roseus TaxID=2070510 RepID=A0A4R4JTU2_9BACT|nr:DUF4249 domain-containing protein [Arundinibacter roseus]TDB58084.1 DUF4249 domain-containing protein [Arundinibacter roseus]